MRMVNANGKHLGVELAHLSDDVARHGLRQDGRTYRHHRLTHTPCATCHGHTHVYGFFAESETVRDGCAVDTDKCCQCAVMDAS